MAKIFISSTYEDLKEYRRIVAESLERMGHKVTAMEKYVATEERPLDKVLKDISKCDLYIGIFAWRYGHKPQNSRYPGKSITELEYIYAGVCRKERLCFIQDDISVWPQEYIDKGEEYNKIVTLRLKILEDHIINMFKKDKKELALLVVKSVANWKKRKNYSKKLSRKYNAEFNVVKYKEHRTRDVCTQTALCLIDEILYLTQTFAGPIYIGIVGGPTIHNIISLLPPELKNIETEEKEDWSRLNFVSLNRAGHATSYDLSANYLCTLLSSIFSGSRHLAVLSNWSSSEEEYYQHCLKNLHILVCSAGSREGYLKELKSYTSIKLPKELIGDFCLWPISSNLRNIALTKSNKHILSAIQDLKPKPEFNSLSDIKEKYSSVSVILPLVSQQIRQSSKKTFTDKLEVGRVVLSSGIITTCVLNESLAKDLIKK